MPTEARTFDVPPPGKAAWVMLLAATVILPLGLVLTELLAAGVIPDALELSAITAIVLAATSLGLGLLMRRRGVQVVDRRLLVQAAFYTQRIPVADLDLDAARIMDIDEHPDLFPKLKTNGFALPGFHAGHFRTGLKQPVFCLLTDRRRVLVLPERGGRLLLLSVARAQALLDELRRSR